MSRRRRKLIECFYCEKLFRSHDITRDHVIPQAMGGRDSKNIVDSCEPCNAEKADRPPTKLEIAKFIRKFGYHPGGETGKRLLERQPPQQVRSYSDSQSLHLINWENQNRARFQAIVTHAHNQLDELQDEIDFLATMKIDKILGRPLLYPGKVFQTNRKPR